MTAEKEKSVGGRDKTAPGRGRRALGKAWSRFYHRRGEGIHSPFVYGLIREVFMRRLGPDEELEAVARYCGCGGVRRIGSAREIGETANLYIFASRPGAEEMERLERTGGAAVFPRGQGGERGGGQSGERDCCGGGRGGGEIPGMERALTVERKRYTLVVFGRGLTPQTFYL